MYITVDSTTNLSTDLEMALIRPEPIMLKNLPIILSRFPKISPIYLV